MGGAAPLFQGTGPRASMGRVSQGPVNRRQDFPFTTTTGCAAVGCSAADERVSDYDWRDTGPFVVVRGDEVTPPSQSD